VSPVTLVIRRPSSETNCWQRALQAPNVSIASGTKVCVTVISAYIAVFANYAFAAAEPAFSADSVRCDAAKVFGDVTSHIRHRP